MTSCIGTYGTYQYLRNRKRVENNKLLDETSSEDMPSEETVWVVMRYSPKDLRATAPVPRYSFTQPVMVNLPRHLCLMLFQLQLISHYNVDSLYFLCKIYF